MITVIGFRYNGEVYGLFKPLNFYFPVRHIRAKIEDGMYLIPERDFIYAADFPVVIGYRYKNKKYKINPEYMLDLQKEKLLNKNYRIKRSDGIYIPKKDFIYEKDFKKYVDKREVITEDIYTSDEDDGEPINILDDYDEYGVKPMNVSNGMSSFSDEDSVDINLVDEKKKELYDNPFASYTDVKFEVEDSVDVDLVDENNNVLKKPKAIPLDNVKKNSYKEVIFDDDSTTTEESEEQIRYCTSDIPLISYLYRFIYRKPEVCINYNGKKYRAYWRNRHIRVKNDGSIVRVRGHYVRYKV